MRRRRAGALVAGFGVALTACGCGGATTPRAATVAVPRAATHLSLGAPGRAIPDGFLGLSIEFQAIRAYTGSDPRAVDPVFEALVRGLSPGAAPRIRIGGDSTDVSWVPAPGVRPPWFTGNSYRLTPSWLATTAAFARGVGARLTLGVDLAADQPALAGGEVAAFRRAFGRGAIASLEVGNEPNLYDKIGEFLIGRSTEPVKARGPGYGPARYRTELAATMAALPRASPAWTFSAPALAAGEHASGAGVWERQMGTLLAASPQIHTLTVHRYPLIRCFSHPGQARYPTIGHLLSRASTAGLAAGVRPWVAIASAHRDDVRVDELNTVACRGEAGVSDTFASALWSTETLFDLAGTGVAGVNVHTLPGSAYAPFTVAERDGAWTAHVLPEYYGLELFARAAPAGSRFVAVRGSGPGGGSVASGGGPGLGAWATRSGGTTRLTLVDTTPGPGRTVVVALPAGDRRATVERMTAPGLAARGGVTLGGRTFGASTQSGRLAPARTTVAPRARGDRREAVVHVAGASAALVTFTR